MRLVLSQFMSLDGVVQAPGGPEEDTDGGFTHGGWSMPYFDPEVMGGFIGEAMEETEPCCSVVAHGRPWPRRGPTATTATTRSPPR